MADRDITAEVVTKMMAGKVRFVERPVEDIPYFKDVKPYKYEGVVTSEFFVFVHNTTLNVLQKKWSWKKYLKALTRFKLGRGNGYDFYFAKETLAGATYLDLSELVDKDGNWLKGDPTKILATPKTYVMSKAKSPDYDFVLGELSTDGTKIERIMRCKKVDEDQHILVMRNTVVDVGAQMISAKVMSFIES